MEQHHEEPVFIIDEAPLPGGEVTQRAMQAGAIQPEPITSVTSLSGAWVRGGYLVETLTCKYLEVKAHKERQMGLFKLPRANASYPARTLSK